MPPKSKRKRTKESEEDAILQEKLDSVSFKYRHLSTDDLEDVGMFEDETPKFLFSDLESIVSELEVEWDPAVMSVLDSAQKSSKTFDINTLKLFVEMLTV